MFDRHTAALPRERQAFAAVVRRLVKTTLFALQVRRERRALLALDDRMLKDIGLSRSLADLEATRDPFDLPAARLKRKFRSAL